LDLTIARVIGWQFLAGMVLAGALWGVYDRVVAYSAALGSLTAAVPNAFLGLRLLLARRDTGAKALMGAAWIGELGKLALTVLFFTLVFTLVRPLSAAALFAGFITTQLVTFSGFLMQHGKDTDNGNGS